MNIPTPQTVTDPLVINLIYRGQVAFNVLTLQFVEGIWLTKHCWLLCLFYLQNFLYFTHDAYIGCHMKNTK